ncbi:MAG: oxygen-insensitive NADPH nitroreductase [Desulfobulbaceae bacterium]|nr:MAG: oxygen-insensitive NADPH nitroreductase [Desulfobulbaceae bacterium]
MNEVIQLLKAHRSIRKFKSEAVNSDLLATIIEAGQAASTSSFIQACTVVQITDQRTRKHFFDITAGQPYVREAPVFLVFCADMNRHKIACEMNQSPMLSGYTEQFLTASIDCALFAQNVMVAAESSGLGGCYIGAIRNQIEKVDRLLNLPSLVYPVFGMCLGYPDQDPEPKPRLPLEVVFKQETYGDTGDHDRMAAYDATVRDYYQNRTGGTKDMSWTEQISDMLQKESRPHMKPFLEKKGFIQK